MWHSNKSVVQTYTTFHAKNGWANIQSLGWKKINPGSNDGVTNLFVLLSAAKANGRKVNVYVVNNQIERAYMN